MRKYLEIIITGFGILLPIFGAILILVINNLPLGLLCFGIGIIMIYLLVLPSKDSQTTEELEFKEIDHALAMSRSIQRLDDWIG